MQKSNTEIVKFKRSNPKTDRIKASNTYIVTEYKSSAPKDIEWLISANKMRGSLSNLVAFLRTECESSTPNHIEWVKNVNKDGDFSRTLFYYLVYKNGQIIVVDLYDYLDEDDKQEFHLAPTASADFITTREHMLEILAEWNRIINFEPQPEEVILTYDGEKVRFTTNNEHS
jgi:hypothetical protein